MLPIAILHVIHVIAVVFFSMAAIIIIKSRKAREEADVRKFYDDLWDEREHPDDKFGSR
jgi:ABC-type phosphate transport system permease subunit